MRHKNRSKLANHLGTGLQNLTKMNLNFQKEQIDLAEVIETIWASRRFKEEKKMWRAISSYKLTVANYSILGQSLYPKKYLKRRI